jgi:hypothetical protein
MRWAKTLALALESKLFAFLVFIIFADTRNVYCVL